MLDNAGSVSLALNEGVDIINRRLYLHGDIDESEIGMVTRGLLTMAAQSDEPVDLWVSTIGGDVDEAFGLHDIMRLVDVPVHTVAFGKVMSAGPLLVAAGEPGVRLATKHTSWMLHNITAGLEDATSLDMRSYGDIVEQSMGTYADLLTEYSTQTKRFWSNMLRSRSDRYFTSEDALEWGLIDFVI